MSTGPWTQGNGKKAYVTNSKPNAVYSSNPTQVDYRAFVNPSWYPAQKAAFKNIDEFIVQCKDSSVQEMVDDLNM